MELLQEFFCYFPRSRLKSKYFLSWEIVPNYLSVWSLYQYTLHQVTQWCSICNDTEIVRLWNIFKVDSYEVFHSIWICISLISIYIGCLFIWFLALYFALLWMGCSYILPFIVPLDFFFIDSEAFLIYSPDMNTLLPSCLQASSPSLWLTGF